MFAELTGWSPSWQEDNSKASALLVTVGYEEIKNILRAVDEIIYIIAF